MSPRKVTDSSGTSFWESIAQTASQEFADMSRHLLATEAPRPFGSEKVSLKEQALTYSLMRDNPDALHQFFTEQGATVESAAKYVKKMNDYLAKGGGAP